MREKKKECTLGILFAIFVALSLLCVIGCSQPDKQPKYEVYLGGQIYGNVRQGGYWKDNRWIRCTNPDNQDEDVEIVSLFVDNNVIYIVGTVSTDSGTRDQKTFGGYWYSDGSTDHPIWVLCPNTPNPGEETSVSGIYVDNGTVYISGTCMDSDGKEIGGYWYGNESELKWKTCPYTNPNGGTSISGIFVDNGTVYISGTYIDSDGKEIGGYWYGNESELKWKSCSNTENPNGRISTSGIIVDNGTVYISGVCEDTDGNYIESYWYGDVSGLEWASSPKPPTQNGSVIRVGDLFVTNNAIYIIGTIDNGGNYEDGYWKYDSPSSTDPKWTVCPNVLFPDENAMVECISELDGIIFIGGTSRNGDTYKKIPGYWKDDGTGPTWSSLSNPLGPNGDATVNSIAVVRK